jgi:hypothetical protein
VVAGHAGDCKQGCTASSQPAIAEDLHLLGLEEVLETAEVPNLEAAAWVDTVESRMHSFLYHKCGMGMTTVQINKLWTRITTTTAFFELVLVTAP